MKTKLLAEYLKLPFYVDAQTGNIIKGTPYSDKQHIWQPDKDWNDLMLVVEKIEEETDIDSFCIINELVCLRYCADPADPDFDDGLSDIDKIVHEEKTKIEAVYNACVEYIKTKQQ